MTTKDFLIPKASMVVALHWHINRNPDLWGTTSNAFQPERFLSYGDEDKTDQNKETEKQRNLRIPSHFMPFQVIIKHGSCCITYLQRKNKLYLPSTH